MVDFPDMEMSLWNPFLRNSTVHEVHFDGYGKLPPQCWPAAAALPLND
jgi:hypothetical protein